MREIYVDTSVIRDELGREYAYDYHIVIDEMDVGPFACESYGLQVKGRNSGEMCTIPHITCSIPRIDELCALVVKSGVTPLTLSDVVDDWL